MDFRNKIFKVVRNDGPDAEVTTETVFHFQQLKSRGADIIHADYSGGGVAFGKLVGLIEGMRMRHSYVQINHKGEFHRGQSTDEVTLTPEGKIQLTDRWQWETKEGTGVCIMEEV